MKVKEEGSGLSGETIEPLVQSDDPNFRPSAVGGGPDGAVYFLDWHNPLIGHMQHHIRDPSRDHVHGRIYRVTYEGRPLLKPAKIAGEPIDKLLELLKTPEDDVRLRAKIELGARDTAPVIAGVKNWVKQFDPNKLEDQHHLMEALWVHQWHNVVNEPLLRQMLQSPDAHARAAALHVLCYWRDRVQNPLPLLNAAASDAAPRVRLEAVRAASFFTGNEAMEVVMAALALPTDYYLDYVIKETTRTLQKTVKGIVLPKNPQAMTRVLANLSNKELLQAPEVDAVLNERLLRRGIEVNDRNKALGALVKLRQTDRVSESLAALRQLDAKDGDPAVAKDLALLLTIVPDDLAKVRPTLTSLAETAARPSIRAAAYAGLVASDGKPDNVWAATEKNPNARIALIDSIILHIDPDFRGKFEPLLTGALAGGNTPAPVRSAALRALPLMGTDFAKTNFAILATHLREGRDLTTASRAVMQLPRDTWAKDQAGPVAESILAWARTIPVVNRTAQDYVETDKAWRHYQW